jgi:hypothetical protein
MNLHAEVICNIAEPSKKIICASNSIQMQDAFFGVEYIHYVPITYT